MKSGTKADELQSAIAPEGGSLPGLSTLASALGDGYDGDDEDVLQRGSSIGRYLVLERLGAGAMGVVYAAYDQELDRKIAIKILRPREGKGDEALRQERLIREAQAIAKLSHPNVVGIFDVGVHDGQVFLAMEHLGGGTLREWVGAKKRPWREIVKIFVEVGQGLAAAHAEGLIHRDFKPDNVLLDKQGKPKVVDFGLVRLQSAALEATAGTVDPSEELSPTDSLHAASPKIANLTRTGAVNGTPAYMAPEQFLGKQVDARTDQFAFCVSLYEALYGERPFAGETVMALAGAVVAERVRNPTKSSDVPPWIRRCLNRGLRSRPENRFTLLGDLIAALKTDPIARLRRRTAIAAAAVAVVAVLVGLQRRRAEFEHRVGLRLADGNQALTEARTLKQQVGTLRERAFVLFDAQDREGGERVWGEARARSQALDRTLGKAERALEAALALDQSRPEAKEKLAEVMFERGLLAESELRREDQSRQLGLLEAVDDSGAYRRRWHQPGTLSVETDPADAKLTLERFDAGDAGQINAVDAGPSLSSPVVGHSLAPGSYRLRIVKAGRVGTMYPFVIKRGETLSVSVTLPLEQEIPDDFKYVPAGRFLYGDHDEDLRVSFLNAVPLHERQLHGFLIKAHEVTFGEWIAFLSSLSPGKRARSSSDSSAMHGAVVLRETGGAWSLELNVSGHHLRAASGQKVTYPGRPKTSPSQDWLKLPVVGISAKEMREYVDWLTTTGKVPGARLCSDAEWERAARGADERTYPSSSRPPAIGIANVDTTYGRTPGAYGLDEVGSYPASRSPFGVDDMVGNAWEVVETDGHAATLVARGGCYYNRAQDARSTNREPIETDLRNHTLGFRVCADWPRATTGSNR